MKARYTCLLALGLVLLGVGPRSVENRAEARPEAATKPAPPAGQPIVSGFDEAGMLLVDGERFFPIGVTMPPPLGATTPWGTDAMDELVAGGVTIFRTGPHGVDWTDELLRQALAWNEAATERGVYTWAHLRELGAVRTGSAEEKRLAEIVTALRRSPGLALWKGVDEPYRRYTPAALQRSYDIVKALDPDHVFHTILGPFSERGSSLHKPPNPPNLEAYARVSDTVGVNVYPVYHHLVGLREPKLHFVGRWLRAIRQATQRNSVTMTLQICFAGSRDRALTGDYVLPTFQQERYMLYDAIINGARGLYFYGGQYPRCQTAEDREHGWNWSFWTTVLRDLLGEVKIGSPLHPILLRPETTKPLRASGKHTEAVTRDNGPNELWLLGAHSGKAGEVVTIRGLPSWARSGELYPSGERVEVRDGVFRHRFPGWGVAVVRFTR